MEKDLVKVSGEISYGVDGNFCICFWCMDCCCWEFEVMLMVIFLCKGVLKILLRLFGACECWWKFLSFVEICSWFVMNLFSYVRENWIGLNMRFMRWLILVYEDEDFCVCHVSWIESMGVFMWVCMCVLVGMGFD